MRKLYTQTSQRAKPNDKWFRMIGVPAAVLPFVYFYVREYGFAWSLILLTFGWGLVTTGVTWEVLRWWVFQALTKYQMLGQPAPVIEDDGRGFRVTLPLV